MKVGDTYLIIHLIAFIKFNSFFIKRFFAGKNCRKTPRDTQKLSNDDQLIKKK